MANCEKLDNCAFFTDQMLNMPAVAALMKKAYCLGDKTQCARYKVAATGAPVPSDLLPNDLERAKRMLGK